MMWVPSTPLPAARGMRTAMSAPDVCVASLNVQDRPYNARPDGRMDCTSVFQQAIDDAARAGGGVIYIPAGRYRFTGPLRLKQGVTLRGDWMSPIASQGRIAGTVLQVETPPGDERGVPFITMEKVSCLTRLAFWYPHQSVDDPKPYPWTIDVTHPSSCGYTVRHVTLVNSWQGLSNGALDGQCYNVALYSDIWGTPLRSGVHIEMVLDITRMEYLRFSPDIWAQSGLPGAPVSAHALQRLQQLLRSATAIRVRRFDWCPLYNARITGYGTGLWLDGKPDASPPGSNGELYEVHITNAVTALRADAVQHPAWLISRSTLHAPGGSALTVDRSVQAPLQFDRCRLTGRISTPEGGGATLAFADCRLDGEVVMQSGRLMLYGCRGSARVRVADSVPVLTSDSTALPIDARDIRQHPAPPSIADPGPSMAPLPYFRPGSPRVLDVRALGARGDEETDDTRAFQRGLAQLARDGGTLFVPAGRYRITGRLRVPSGVDLRGIAEGPCHSMVPGSCLLPESLEGPFITLDARSSLRGLSIWYRDQDLDSPKPYPWSVQARGPGVHLRDVCLSNAWLGADFASTDTTGHVIAGLTGSPLMEGLRVANARHGAVENVQFVIHYWDRNDSKLPTGRHSSDGGIALQARQLVAMRFGRCGDERIRNTFAYGAQTVLALEAGFRGVAHLHGSDGCRYGVTASGDAKAVMACTNAAGFLERWPAGFVTLPDFTGRLDMANSSSWGDIGLVLKLEGAGETRWRLLNAASFESLIRQPRARLWGVWGANPHTVLYQRDWNPSHADGLQISHRLLSFPGEQVSHRRPVQASSQYSPQEGPERTVDNCTPTKWSSGPQTPHWLEVDLQSPHRVYGIELIHTAGAGVEPIFTTRAWRLLGQPPDTAEWILLDQIADNTRGLTAHPVNRVLQRVRLEIAEPAQNNDPHARIHELRIWGVPEQEARP